METKRERERRLAKRQPSLADLATEHLRGRKREQWLDNFDALRPERIQDIRRAEPFSPYPGKREARINTRTNEAPPRQLSRVETFVAGGDGALKIGKPYSRKGVERLPKARVLGPKGIAKERAKYGHSCIREPGTLPVGYASLTDALIELRRLTQS